MNIKYLLIFPLLLFTSELKASVTPCTPVYPFVQKRQNSKISIKSIPWSPNTNIRKGTTEVYKEKKLLYSLDFYLFSEYSITDSSGYNLVLLDSHSLKFYEKGKFIKRITSHQILSKITSDSLRNKYFGITHAPSSYFLDYGIPVCKIAKKKKNSKFKLNPNNLIVDENRLYFRTIENKWIVFNLSTGDLNTNYGKIKPDVIPASIWRNYKFFKYPDLGSAKTKTENGTLLSEKISSKLSMVVTDWDSADLKLIFDISFDKNGALLPESELIFFHSRHKALMKKVELAKVELDELIQSIKLKIKIPKELLLFQTKYIIHLKK